MFEYEIVTTNGRAHGTLFAESEAAVKEVLAEQYAPADNKPVDSEGNPITHEVISIDLIEIT